MGWTLGSARGGRGPGPALPVRLATALACLLALAACSGTTTPASPPRPPTSTLPAGVELTVERVVDGDTIRVEHGERVRLIGIDTPESVKPGSPVECFALEASRFLSSLLPAGTRVRLVGDVEPRDRYGRLLAYVYRVPDGLFVNVALARDGYAQLLTIPPNVAHTAELVAAARSAREANRGLWSACPPEPAR